MVVIKSSKITKFINWLICIIFMKSIFVEKDIKTLSLIDLILNEAPIAAKIKRIKKIKL